MASPASPFRSHQQRQFWQRLWKNGRPLRTCRFSLELWHHSFSMFPVLSLPRLLYPAVRSSFLLHLSQVGQFCWRGIKSVYELLTKRLGEGFLICWMVHLTHVTQNLEERIQALVGKVLRLWTFTNLVKCSRNPWPSPNTEEYPCHSFIYSSYGHLPPMSSCLRQDHAKSA